MSRMPIVRRNVRAGAMIVAMFPTRRRVVLAWMRFGMWFVHDGRRVVVAAPCGRMTVMAMVVVFDRYIG
jgi:hypothetical protein